jgi:hypothetical protein
MNKLGVAYPLSCCNNVVLLSIAARKLHLPHHSYITDRYKKQHNHTSFMYTIALYSIYMQFNTCASSVLPDQLAYPCFLIRICTGRILVRNNLINLKVNSVDYDQPARMCQLIWIYSVRPGNKLVSVE